MDRDEDFFGNCLWYAFVCLIAVKALHSLLY
jgi:hypothetical protein